MDKLKMHSPNLTDENVAKIRDLFPGCVTEAADETGKLRLVVDFDQLRQELSDHLVQGGQERYRLDWPGKREALATANAPIAKTFRPSRDDSLNFESTSNLFIQGDNLDALKIFQETYLGKVKMIFIDPRTILGMISYMRTIFRRKRRISDYVESERPIWKPSCCQYRQQWAISFGLAVNDVCAIEVGAKYNERRRRDIHQY
uniref:Uncharacterized protein n=1 Tax=Phenylobacterium glaciei TaxID=2803784 RepID=A0A974P3I1_9CAUL|nr:hypothetical protein JKL49_00975 [Phenylobacterium glaciei]